MKTFLRRSAPLLFLATIQAEARSIPPQVRPQVQSFGTFLLNDLPLGKNKAPSAEKRPAHLAGGTIAPVGEGALVLDAAEGELVLLDAGEAVIGRMSVGVGATQVVSLGDRAWVTDRDHDRIAVVKIQPKAEDAAQVLTEESSFSTGTEPFGLALTPDGKTLLVTTVVEHALTAYDARVGKELGNPLWRIDVPAEPRAVSISPDGKQALVTSMSEGLLSRVTLATRAIDYVTLNPPPRTMEGKRFATNAYAALFIGNGLSVVAHQVSRPDTGEIFVNSPGTYGGSMIPPIQYQISFIDESGKLAAATVTTHQPRSMVWDGQSDTLYVAGYGSDDVMAIAAASQTGVRMSWHNAGFGVCGPAGLALNGTKLLVHCDLSRIVGAVDTSDPPTTQNAAKVTYSDELFNTPLGEAAQRGKALFRQGNNAQISMAGAMACSSCHAEGRADGLSWRIEKHTLQTPVLAGRLSGTHPFKWDGKDATLNDSVTNTVRRLGGGGFSGTQLADLTAFLDSLERPRAAVRPAELVDRGKEVFESGETGCASCHSGDTFSDGKSHDLANDLDAVDTPSLIGLAMSAPYYHDGSAATLRSALLGNGTIHGMGSTKGLNDADMKALIAYLETL
jgi:cytochrome c553